MRKGVKVNGETEDRIENENENEKCVKYNIKLVSLSINFYNCYLHYIRNK